MSSAGMSFKTGIIPQMFLISKDTGQQQGLFMDHLLWLTFA